MSHIESVTVSAGPNYELNPSDSGTTGAPAAGYWYGTPTASVVAAATTNAVCGMTPWMVFAATSLDRIRAEVTVAAASSVVRLGIYRTAANGLPSGLVGDFGTIDGNSATVQDITIDVDLVPGLYWLAAVAQGGTPTLRSLSAGATDVSPSDGTLSAVNRTGLYATVAGALPAVPTIVGAIANPPRVMVRAAA